MYHRKLLISLIFLNFTAVFSVQAQEPCTLENRICVLEQMKTEAALIDNVAWRDQTYRELAKTYAFEGKTDQAIAFIAMIETPDTKAMTIRGIGMAVADHKLSKEEYARIFTALRKEAGTITHPPSFAIALTYIAMAQAFAGDDEGAWKTATEMENDALRHKAYAETAEIQAEKGNFEAAKKSIGFINDLSFRNKSAENVTKILADKSLLTQAYDLAMTITNPYKKTQGLQYILDTQKPREIPHQ